MISEITFKVGDHVEYINGHRGACARSWIGWQGIIEQIDVPGEVCIVRFNKRQRALGASPWNLKYVELQYDPTQMGDREDDI